MLEDGDLGTSAGVPQSRGMVLGRGADAVARGAEDSGIDRAIMLEDEDLGAGTSVPQSRSVVHGGDPAAHTEPMLPLAAVNAAAALTPAPALNSERLLIMTDTSPRSVLPCVWECEMAGAYFMLEQDQAGGLACWTPGTSVP